MKKLKIFSSSKAPNHQKINSFVGLFIFICFYGTSMDKWVWAQTLSAILKFIFLHRTNVVGIAPILLWELILRKNEKRKTEVLTGLES